MNTLRLYSRALLFASVVLLGCSEDAPAPLDLNGEAASVAVASGDAQDGAAGSVLSAPLVVLVTDAEGRPVPAVPVSWETSAGSVSPAVDTTGDDGRAAAEWTLPDTAGVYVAHARVEDVGAVSFSATALPGVGRLSFRFVDAGSYHACGITTTEELYCWGYNGDGQLGIAASEPRLFPTRIPGVARYRAVSGGRYHTCGLELSGRIPSCWGEDYDKRAESGDPITYQSLSAGLVHTCALSLARELLCWGINREGQLGAGFVGEPDSLPVSVGVGFRAVTSNGLHSCAVRESGEAVCWGFNAEGQLGLGSLSRVVPAPTPVSGGLQFVTEPLIAPQPPDPSFPLPDGPWIAAGYSHTCAISRNGSTYCWGLGESGQLGTGDRTSSSVPRPVGGTQQFVRITSGYRHSCGLTAGGQAYCWGSNATGQLGDGTLTDRLVPTAVSGSLTFAFLKAGDLSTCGVTAAGVAYCWGDNEYGQLGLGNTTSSSVPVRVAFQP